MRLIAALGGMSARGRIKLASWTIFGTLGCIAVAVSINYALFRSVPGALERAMVSATLIPVLLAGPLFFYLTLKLRELAIANYKLVDAAATDFLTRCLNRGSFSSRVESLLSGPPGEELRGALLVIDADHFKKINDRFGHLEGDIALKAIADAIHATVREDDLVGRLGGEEFGIFLPGATEQGAATVAERIREAVNRVVFRPEGGDACQLSVSVGCAAFERTTTFSELFRVADERLYEAKSAGRNRVVLTRIAFDTPQFTALH